MISLFLSGDVMPGRGIDQILPQPSRPQLFESYVRDARDYVALAEKASGRLPRGIGGDYIWGDALAELERRRPDLRLINLETAITTADDCWPDKGIHYRMSPANIGCLTAAGLDCCALANNHVLDWARAGLVETLATLAASGIASAGAGLDSEAAAQPAALPLPGGGRLLVVARGEVGSGIPAAWAAGPGRPGVALLDELTPASAEALGERIATVRRPGDVALVSIHWGSNWGYHVAAAQTAFAHALIDHAGIDVVHGHSSHHPRPIEVYRGRLILYGCGDLINDYEGIGGYEAFRPEVALMYFVDLTADGALRSLRLCPMRIRRFRLERATAEDTGWLARLLSGVGGAYGTRVLVAADGDLTLEWATAA